MNRRNPEQFQLRLPEGLRDRIKEAAEAQNRSMNAEIVARLEESLGPANPSYDVPAARARLRRAIDEVKAAMEELDLAEMLG